MPNAFNFRGPGTLTMTDQYGNLVVSIPFDQLHEIGSQVKENSLAFDGPFHLQPLVEHRVTYDLRVSKTVAPDEISMTIGEAAYGPLPPKEKEIEDLL